MSLVWTNGCFDVLHRGHFELFKHAKSLGDTLIVGIDADKKVKNDKGTDRPVNNQEDRKFALESIKYIDEVVIFNKMVLSDQALGAVMMALQKSLLEETDIVPVLKGFNFIVQGDSQDELLVTNPPTFKVGEFDESEDA